MADNGNLKNGNGAFKNTVGSLLEGLDSFLSTKTVVGDPITVGDVILVPLVDVQFGVGAGTFNKGPSGTSGGGGLGAKMSPTAVLVISNGTTRLVNVKTSSGFDRIIDLVPDFVEKFKEFTGKDKNKSADRAAASEALEETIIEASKIEGED